MQAVTVRDKGRGRAYGCSCEIPVRWRVCGARAPELGLLELCACQPNGGSSVSSAGGAKSEPLSRPLQRRNTSIQVKNCQGANFPFWVRRARLLPFPHRAWDSEGGPLGVGFRQPRVPAVGAMSSPGGAKFEPPSHPLDGATRLFKPKLSVSSAGGAKSEPLSRPLSTAQRVCSSQKLPGCKLSLFGCEGLGFCLS